MDGIDPLPRLASKCFYNGISRDASTTLMDNSYITNVVVAFGTLYEYSIQRQPCERVGLCS